MPKVLNLRVAMEPARARPAAVFPALSPPGRAAASGIALSDSGRAAVVPAAAGYYS